MRPQTTQVKSVSRILGIGIFEKTIDIALCLRVTKICLTTETKSNRYFAFDILTTA
jgi:hypothetical protein